MSRKPLTTSYVADTVIEYGKHNAICSNVVDLGEHTFDYKGKRVTVCKLAIIFELELISIRTNSPHVLVKEHSLNFGRNAQLRRDLVSWRGREFIERVDNGQTSIYSSQNSPKPFDVYDVIGAKATLLVAKNEREPNSLFPIIEIILPPTASNQLQIFDSNYIPEWVLKKQAGQIYDQQQQQYTSENVLGGDDEDIPF